MYFPYFEKKYIEFESCRGLESIDIIYIRILGLEVEFEERFIEWLQLASIFLPKSADILRNKRHNRVCIKCLLTGKQVVNHFS